MLGVAARLVRWRRNFQRQQIEWLHHSSPGSKLAVLGVNADNQSSHLKPFCLGLQYVSTCSELFHFMPLYQWVCVLSHIKQKHFLNWSKILISLQGKGKRKESNVGNLHFLSTERLLEIEHRVYCQNSSMPERANKIWSLDNYSCNGVTNAVSSSLKLSSLRVWTKYMCALWKLGLCFYFKIFFLQIVPPNLKSSNYCNQALSSPFLWGTYRCQLLQSPMWSCC